MMLAHSLRKISYTYGFIKSSPIVMMEPFRNDCHRLRLFPVSNPEASRINLLIMLVLQLTAPKLLSNMYELLSYSLNAIYVASLLFEVITP